LSATGPRIGSSQDSPDEIVPDVIQGGHQEHNRPVRNRFDELRTGFDHAIQGTTKNGWPSFGKGYAGVVCRDSWSAHGVLRFIG
jgi:hypothetical protein